MRPLPRISKSDNPLSRIQPLTGSLVEVHLIDGRVLKGRLTSVDPDLLNILLEKVETNDGKKAPLVLVSGAFIASIYFVSPSEPAMEDLDLKSKILMLLAKSPRLSAVEIAKMLNEKPELVRRVIRQLKKSGLIEPRASRSKTEKR
ncbi:MAG: winged helix-turn-helix transcriptional regulator [Candidatus Nezhaarchaeales archaeon]